MFQQDEEPTKIVTSSTAFELQFILLEHKTQDFIKTTAGDCICKLIQWDFLAIKSWNPISFQLVLLDLFAQWQG
jgi:hypothetical protein